MVVAEAVSDGPTASGSQPHLHQGMPDVGAGLTISVFIAIGLALVLLDVLARRRRPRSDLGQLVRWTIAQRSAQFAIVLAWCVDRAHFFYAEVSPTFT